MIVWYISGFSLLMTFYLSRHLRRDLKLYLKQIPCKVALVQDSLIVDVLRNHTISEPDIGDQKVYSMSKSKPVPPSNSHFTEQNDSSETSSRRDSLSTSYLESSKTSLFTSSSTLKSEEHNLLSGFGSSSKQEISGKQAILTILYE